MAGSLHRNGWSWAGTILAATWGLSAQTPLTVPGGTPVRLRLSQTVSSLNSKAGAPVLFTAAEDFSIGGVIVIPAGTPVGATVVRSQPAGPGKAAFLAIKVSEARLASGLRIPLRTSAGGTVPAAASSGQGTVAMPVMQLGDAPVAVTGRAEAAMIKGTEITAYIRDTISLTPGKLPSKAATPGSTPVAAVLTNEDVVAAKLAGQSDAGLIARITGSFGNYRLEPPDLAALKKSGISSQVIQAMIDARKAN